jgi:hypothetical protein
VTNCYIFLITGKRIGQEQQGLAGVGVLRVHLPFLCIAFFLHSCLDLSL